MSREERERWLQGPRWERMYRLWEWCVKLTLAGLFTAAFILAFWVALLGLETLLVLP